MTSAEKSLALAMIERRIADCRRQMEWLPEPGACAKDPRFRWLLSHHQWVDKELRRLCLRKAQISWEPCDDRHQAALEQSPYGQTGG